MLPPRLRVAHYAAFVLLSLSAVGRAQDTPPPPPAAAVQVQPVSRFDFESEALLSCWTATDASATLAITRDRANVALGEGALEFVYQARPGAFEQMSTGALAVGSANAMAVRVKASSPTPLSLGLAERNGARYQGLLWIEADQWVEVRAPLSDLVLAQDSSDDNGQLDADQISGFFLADLSNLPGEVGQALGRKQGEQRLWVDQLELLSDPKMRPRGRIDALDKQRVLVMDDFEGGVVWGLPVRQAGLQTVAGAPGAPGQRALSIGYTLGLGRWVGYVLAPPGRFDLTGAQQFSMWAKTDLNARLVVVLEERDGTKYDAAAKAPPDGKWHLIQMPLETFAPSDPAADENGRLDAGQIHRAIVLIDTFDADVRPGGLGSVAIDDVGFVAPAEVTP